MKSKTSPLSKLYMALIFLFLYAPIAVIIVFSFNASTSTYIFTEFSTKWYVEFFNDSYAMRALRNTFVLAIVNCVISTVFGTVSSVGIFKMKNKWMKSAVMSVTNIPMMNPEIVTGISMMLLFVFVGTLLKMNDVLGFTTLLIAHVTFSLPYVILSVIPKLNQLDPHIYEAAVDLGCKPHRAFRKVILPEISSGIITGAIMSFTLSLDDFIISYFTSGPSFQTLPIYIFSMTKKRVKPDMFALSAIIFVTILVLLILVNVAESRAEKKELSRRGDAK